MDTSGPLPGETGPWSPKKCPGCCGGRTHKGDRWSAITADQYHSQATINK